MIVLKEVSKRFRQGGEDIYALQNVSLHFKEGEVVVIKGKSGSGKSTMLSLIAALSKPTSGEVIVDGEHISKLSDDFAARFRLHNIGIIFQKYNLLEELSVFENLLAPLALLKSDAATLQKRIDDALGEVDMLSKKEVRVRSLSGGEQQRVAIARSILNDPKIILADEPTANLDAKLSKQFIEYLRRLKKGKRTIIVATHDPLFYTLDFVDRIIEMEGGNVVAHS